MKYFKRNFYRFQSIKRSDICVPYYSQNLFILPCGFVGCFAGCSQAYALSYSDSSSYKSGKYYTRLTNVELTGNQRVDIVNVAKSQVGYQESGSSSKLSGTVKGSGNYTEYGRWYGMQDKWCAMFVSWCANVAGISTSIVPSHSYTPTGLNWFISRGRAYSRATVAKGGYTPQAGDIIYFKSSRNSRTACWMYMPTVPHP